MGPNYHCPLSFVIVVLGSFFQGVDGVTGADADLLSITNFFATPCANNIPPYNNENLRRTHQIPLYKPELPSVSSIDLKQDQKSV